MKSQDRTWLVVCPSRYILNSVVGNEQRCLGCPKRGLFPGFVSIKALPSEAERYQNQKVFFLRQQALWASKITLHRIVRRMLVSFKKSHTCRIGGVGMRLYRRAVWCAVHMYQMPYDRSGRAHYTAAQGAARQDAQLILQTPRRGVPSN